MDEFLEDLFAFRHWPRSESNFGSDGVLVDNVVNVEVVRNPRSDLGMFQNSAQRRVDVEQVVQSGERMEVETVALLPVGGPGVEAGNVAPPVLAKLDQSIKYVSFGVPVGVEGVNRDGMGK